MPPHEANDEASAVRASEVEHWAHLESKSATVEADLLRATAPRSPRTVAGVLALAEAAVAWLTTLADS